MVTERSVPALEEQRDILISSYIEQVQRDPHLCVLHKIGDNEFQGLAGYILASLGDYLEGSDAELEACLNFIGNTCFQVSIPLLETSYALYILEDKVTNLLGKNAADVEVVARARKFFDFLVLELLRRY